MLSLKSSTAEHNRGRKAENNGCRRVKCHTQAPRKKNHQTEEALGGSATAINQKYSQLFVPRREQRNASVWPVEPGGVGVGVEGKLGEASKMARKDADA